MLHILSPRVRLLLLCLLLLCLLLLLILSRHQPVVVLLPLLAGRDAYGDCSEHTRVMLRSLGKNVLRVCLCFRLPSMATSRSVSQRSP